MAKGKKTTNEMIIDALATGKSLFLSDINNMVNENSDKKIRQQDMSSLVSKISNSDKCALGHFVKREKTDSGYVYTLVKEALKLEPQQLYDLSHKAGRNRFTLDDAVKKYPSLKKHVHESKSKAASKSPTKQKTKKAPASASAPEAASQTTSDQEAQNILAGFVKELIGQGGLKVNVNLNVRLKGIGE